MNDRVLKLASDYAKNNDDALNGFVDGYSQALEDRVEILEVHFEVVSYLLRNSDAEKVYLIETMRGIGGLYELAEELTMSFTQEYAEREWDGDFFDTLELFLDDKLK